MSLYNRKTEIFSLLFSHVIKGVKMSGFFRCADLTQTTYTCVALIPGWHYPSAHLFASFHVLMSLNAEANASTYTRHEYDTSYNTNYPDYDVNFEVI